MKTFKTLIAKSITSAVENIFSGTQITESEIFDLLEYPSDTSMGDIALPCFKLSKMLRRSPIQIASALAEAFSDISDIKAEAVNGYLNKIEVTDIRRYEVDLYDYLRNNYDELMRRIADTGILSDDDNSILGEALTRFTEKFRTEVYGILPNADM